jgi:toxin ParE1/3/4
MIWMILYATSAGIPRFMPRRFAETIVLATRRLQRFPESGRMIPGAEDKTLREIIVQGYRVMYRHESGRVLVPAVMHANRDVGAVADKPWDES